MPASKHGSEFLKLRLGFGWAVAIVLAAWLIVVAVGLYIVRRRERM